LMAFKRDGAYLFQTHHNFAFEGHDTEVYHGKARPRSPHPRLNAATTA
jgi:hypothetical protein